MDDKSFQLEIITPISSQELIVEWVEIESPTGSFLVGPGHADLISIIKNKSVILYKVVGSQEESCVASVGIFSVVKNKAIALLDQ